MSIGFYCPNPKNVKYRDLLGDTLAKTFDIVSITCLQQDKRKSPGCIKALIVYVNDDHAGLISETLQLFKASFPCAPIAVIVDHAGLQSALLAIRCRAWCYHDLDTEDKSLQQVLIKLSELGKISSRQSKRDPLFPANKNFSKNRPGVLYNNSVMNTVEKFINEHISTKLAGKDLAALVGLETRSFLRLFRREKGIGLRQYVNQCRINLACQLLSESHLAVQVIAHEVGFVDAAHFVKVFKEYVGSTPGYYRKRKHTLHKLTGYGNNLSHHGVVNDEGMKVVNLMI